MYLWMMKIVMVMTYDYHLFGNEQLHFVKIMIIVGDVDGDVDVDVDDDDGRRYDCDDCEDCRLQWRP